MLYQKSSAKIQFTKSFVRVINVDTHTYKIYQEEEKSLAVYDQHGCIYYYDSVLNEVVYEENVFPIIKRVLHQAHIDRYAIKI